MKSLLLAFAALVALPGSAVADFGPNSLLAEAVIGQSVYLPVLTHGHAGTVVLDTGSDASWVFPSALQKLGIPVSPPKGGQAAPRLDYMTSGMVTFHDIPLGFDMRSEAPAGMAPVVGVIGANVLSIFDLLFDGPSQQMRLYAPSAKSDAAGWLPPGIRASDCVMTEIDFNYPKRIFLPTTLNGHVVHSMFDSGSLPTNMNLPAAQAIGVTTDAPNVQLFPAAPQFMAFRGQKVWRVSAGVTLATNTRRFSPDLVFIYEHLPREKGPKDPELSIGLDAVRNQLFFVSYSRRLACLSLPLTERLTSNALSRMTTFWRAFFNEPTEIRDTARFQHQMTLPLILDLGASGIHSLSVRVVDMNAMAAEYPSVAADFKRAGLTPEQWSLFRRSLYTAFLTWQALQSQGGSGGGSASSSVTAVNIAFLEAHQTEVSGLRLAGMWFPP